MPMEEEVVVLYAGTRGFMDDVPVESVRKFEGEYLEFVRNNKPEILEELKEKKDLDDEAEKKLKAAVEEFKKGFQA